MVPSGHSVLGCGLRKEGPLRSVFLHLPQQGLDTEGHRDEELNSVPHLSMVGQQQRIVI